MARYFGLHQVFIDLFEDLLDWLLADKEERKLMKDVPKYCRYCELLGICRDEDKNWKCTRGCLILNTERINNCIK